MSNWITGELFLLFKFFKWLDFHRVNSLLWISAAKAYSCMEVRWSLFSRILSLMPYIGHRKKVGLGLNLKYNPDNYLKVICFYFFFIIYIYIYITLVYKVYEIPFFVCLFAWFPVFLFVHLSISIKSECHKKFKKWWCLIFWKKQVFLNFMKIKCVELF